MRNNYHLVAGIRNAAGNAITQLIRIRRTFSRRNRCPVRNRNMYVCRFCIALVFFKTFLARNLAQNETPAVSTYAKVANFGGGTRNADEARSSGMSLYTQSSHAKIISGQNLKNRVSPYYTAKPSRMSQGVTEIYPAKGEVQERFNPRPYFDYLHVQPKKHRTSSGSSKPSPVYGTPFDSFPVFQGSQSNANPGDSYSPTFDSYMPSTRADSAPMDSYNPSMSEDNAKDSDSPTGSMTYPMDSYRPTEGDDSGATADNGEYPGFPYAPSDDQPATAGKETASDAGSEMTATVKNPSYHDYSHQQYQDVGPEIVNTVKPTVVEMPYQDHPPPNYHYRQEEAPMNGNGDMDSSDMAKQMPSGYPKLPEYLDHDPKENGYHYPDPYHYDHHPVYHEITTTTTTTTEAPEERVNNNYSYYYLGRKLWYIPLYFSAYFIIYITVLILKSIARHKVNFWHDLHNLGSRRQGRNLKLDETTRNVIGSIESARAKYMM